MKKKLSLRKIHVVLKEIKNIYLFVADVVKKVEYKQKK